MTPVAERAPSPAPSPESPARASHAPDGGMAGSAGSTGSTGSPEPPAPADSTPVPGRGVLTLDGADTGSFPGTAGRPAVDGDLARKVADPAPAPQDAGGLPTAPVVADARETSGLPTLGPVNNYDAGAGELPGARLGEDSPAALATTEPAPGVSLPYDWLDEYVQARPDDNICNDCGGPCGGTCLSELRRIIRMYYPEPPPNTINVLADFPLQPIHKIPGRSTP